MRHRTDVFGKVGKCGKNLKEQMLQRERTERERAVKLVKDTAVSVIMALLFSLPYLQS